MRQPGRQSGLLCAAGMDIRAQIKLYRVRGGRDRPQFQPRAPMLQSANTLPNTSEQSARISIGFINWAHAIDHYVMLIFPTVVISLGPVYGLSYAELIALGTPSFIAFGVFALPAGWLADR